MLLGQYTVDSEMPYGNGVMERINDFRKDVINLESFVNNESDANCTWISIMVDGEPFSLVIARKTIEEKDWLKLDYGNGYWRGRRAALIAALK